MRHLRDMLVLAALAAWTTTPALAEDRGAMALALAAADARDWTTARAAATRSGPMAEALVGWTALRAGHGDFRDYVAFVTRNPDWPGLALLRQRGDAVMTADAPPDLLRAWFDGRRPVTLTALDAYLTTLPRDQHAAARAAFWTDTPLTATEEATLLADHGPLLIPLATARATAMLDAQDWAQAERLLPRIPDEQRPLLAARIALQAGRAGVDELILSLPDDQRADPGLTLDRFLWRVRARQHEGAQDLMLVASASADTLRAPDLWAQMRVDYSRLAMRNGDWDRAYALAVPHHLDPSNRHYADLEWLAGFAALKIGRPQDALDHFLHLETVVGSQISMARALYWQGRAYEALDRADAAHAVWSRAADMPGVYYGQLAAERIGRTMPSDFAVPGPAIETLPDWRGTALAENGVFRAGLWLMATGHVDGAQRFFLHLAETAEAEDIGRMARLMLESHHPWHALRLAKQAANKGVIYPAAQFPLTGLAGARLGVPPELVLSIARQESEFNHTARSPVGARGLMQVMPATAEAMARKLREPFDEARLTVDADYNARLGAAYLAGLRERFGASTALIASGYNAGPGRPARWLGDFGDLRRHADPVDWVEMIPFDETRNYVMRVTEAMPIYRARMAGRPAPLVPTFDLTGGGLMPAPPLRLTLALSRRPAARPFIGPSLPQPGATPASAALVAPPPVAPGTPVDAGVGMAATTTARGAAVALTTDPAPAPAVPPLAEGASLGPVKSLPVTSASATE